MGRGGWGTPGFLAKNRRNKELEIGGSEEKLSARIGDWMAIIWASWYRCFYCARWGINSPQKSRTRMGRF